ncbi:hypothetical protein Pelo_12420 [Pelomyxa schiedti]|nr:hypothetical protein Pelo_12420 [Pelomyxa schiedti]
MSVGGILGGNAVLVSVSVVVGVCYTAWSLGGGAARRGAGPALLWTAVLGLEAGLGVCAGTQGEGGFAAMSLFMDTIGAMAVALAMVSTLLAHTPSTLFRSSTVAALTGFVYCKVTGQFEYAIALYAFVTACVVTLCAMRIKTRLARWMILHMVCLSCARFLSHFHSPATPGHCCITDTLCIDNFALYCIILAVTIFSGLCIVTLSSTTQKTKQMEEPKTTSQKEQKPKQKPAQARKHKSS